MLVFVIVGQSDRLRVEKAFPSSIQCTLSKHIHSYCLLLRFLKMSS